MFWFQDFDELCASHVIPQLGAIGFELIGVRHSQAGFMTASFDLHRPYMLDFYVEVGDAGGSGLQIRRDGQGLGSSLWVVTKQPASRKRWSGDVTAVIAKEIFEEDYALLLRVADLIA